MVSPVQITSKQLSRLVGTPACPTIIDVRIQSDFLEEPSLIPGAFRCPHTSVHDIDPEALGERVVVYCQKGLKLSEGAAAVLRAAGVHAEVLEGGHLHWLGAGEPLVQTSALPALEAGDSSTWVTRLRPKVDRVACPWLIRRFIDPRARFLFVAATEVEAVAEKFDAIPFDMPAGRWTHRDEQCSFDAFLSEFGLASDALATVANVVRAADTDRLDQSPEAAGLLALSLGLSRMHSDDLVQINAAMPFYDALYRWARDAMNESHDWPVQSRSEHS